MKSIRSHSRNATNKKARIKNLFVATTEVTSKNAEIKNQLVAAAQKLLAKIQKNRIC